MWLLNNEAACSARGLKHWWPSRTFSWKFRQCMPNNAALHWLSAEK